MTHNLPNPPPFTTPFNTKNLEIRSKEITIEHTDLNKDLKTFTLTVDSFKEFLGEERLKGLSILEILYFKDKVRKTTFDMITIYCIIKRYKNNFIISDYDYSYNIKISDIKRFFVKKERDDKIKKIIG